MTRLPELERQLLLAACAQERPRRRWWRIGLLGTGTTFVVAATAFGTVQLLLPEGEPVPKTPVTQRPSLPRTVADASTKLVSVRGEDPEGGLPWGFSITPSKDGRLACYQLGRVQGDQLGIIGRDAAFDNDGKFHPLSRTANQSGGCDGVPPDGQMRLHEFGPPIPASGFTGDVSGAAGGCRENVPASTMSPQTRRRFRDVPVCALGSLRDIRYGLAGKDAVTIEYEGQTIRPNPNHGGAYLFVHRHKPGKRTMRITFQDGYVCRISYPERRSPLGDPDIRPSETQRLRIVKRLREAASHGCPG